MKTNRALPSLPHGKINEIAHAIGRHQSTVCTWKQVPAEFVPAVSEITEIPAHVLRPDLPQLFPHPAMVGKAD